VEQSLPGSQQSPSGLLKLKCSPRNKSNARGMQQEGEKPKVNKFLFCLEKTRAQKAKEKTSHFINSEGRS